MKIKILTAAGLFIFSLTPLFLMIKQDSLADHAASLAFVILLTVVLAQAFDLFFRSRPKRRKMTSDVKC